LNFQLYERNKFEVIEFIEQKQLKMETKFAQSL